MKRMGLRLKLQIGMDKEGKIEIIIINVFVYDFWGYFIEVKYG